jgi:hypothetical protein
MVTKSNGENFQMVAALRASRTDVEQSTSTKNRIKHAFCARVAEKAKVAMHANNLTNSSSGNNFFRLE